MRCPSPSPCSRLLRTPGVSSKQSRGSVLPGRGTGSAGHLQSRKHRDFADRGTDGQDQWDNQGAFGLWPSCLLEELTQLRSCPLPLLPPPTLHSVKGTGLILPVPCPLLGRAHGETRVLVLAGMEQQERRGPQHLVGKPCAHADPCPQVSPPPSLRPCPPQWPGLWLQPMAAGTRLLCCGRPGSGIRARAAMVGPEPRLPSRHGRSGRAGAGAAPLGLVALGSRGAVRPWAAQWPLSPPTPGHAWGMHPLMQVAVGTMSPSWNPGRALLGRERWGGHGAGTPRVLLPRGPTCGHRLRECHAMSPRPVWLLRRRGRAGDCV